MFTQHTDLEADREVYGHYQFELNIKIKDWLDEGTLNAFPVGMCKKLLTWFCSLVKNSLELKK